MSTVPIEIEKFLQAPTPPEWVSSASQRLAELLLDHANCEKKAAASALSLMFRYPQHGELAARMSRLAREELRHFEQVAKLMQSRGVDHVSVPASSYAARLRAASRTNEPGRLADTLIVGALIEARSCERFALLIPHLPEDVAELYRGLLNSEKRHFEVYLALAREHGGHIDARVAQLAELESELVNSNDDVFAFHSGIPV